MPRFAKLSLPVADGVRRRLRRWRRRLQGQVAVLMYHRVADVACDPWQLCVKPNHFAQQLEVLKRQGRVLSASALSQALEIGELPRRGVVLTFDDGYADNLLAARPLLEKHSLPATLFVTTGAQDSQLEFWWDELERIFLHPNTLPDMLELTVNGRPCRWSLGKEANYDLHTWKRDRSWRASSAPQTIRQRVYYEIWSALRPLPAVSQQAVLMELGNWARLDRVARPACRSLSVKETCHLMDGGIFELGAHTVNHPALSAHPLSVQEEEIRASKERLESQSGGAVRHFAYPYGDYSEETVELVREIGFAAAFTTEEAAVGSGMSPWRLPRMMVCDWDGEEFARRLAKLF